VNGGVLKPVLIIAGGILVAGLAVGVLSRLLG
jgi:hypothetical protein